MVIEINCANHRSRKFLFFSRVRNPPRGLAMPILSISSLLNAGRAALSLTYFGSPCAWHPQGPIHPQPSPVPLHLAWPTTPLVCPPRVAWRWGGPPKCSGTGRCGVVGGPCGCQAASPFRTFTQSRTWSCGAVFAHTRLVCAYSGGTTGQNTRYGRAHRQPHTGCLSMACHAWRSASHRRASHLSDRWEVRCMV
jgi:hypothetical protein